MAQQQETNTTLSFQHAGKTYTASFPSSATLIDLSLHVTDALSIPEANQKYLISPKPGMVKPPFANNGAPLLLRDVASTARKILLLGSTPTQISKLNEQVRRGDAMVNRRAGDGPVKAASPGRSRDWRRMHDEIEYKFHEVKPIDFLPFPERSTRYLNRLRNDPGIKAAMIKHKWSVPLLTELNPAENTTHESRTLGLNENKGQRILLRLRTDDYDGYRDYKTVRDCLCHELAHNVHGEHNREFYDLMKQIQEEVKRNDWKHGGKALSDNEYYDPGDNGRASESQWIGGTRKLGSGSGSQASASEPRQDATQQRRNATAKAAEERMKKTHDNNSHDSTQE